MKRILLVTSAYTGAGHKSIAEALSEQFSQMEEVELKVIDGFELAGQFGVRLAKLYGMMSRHATVMYNASWRYTMAHPYRYAIASQLCWRRFSQCLRSYQPDLIITVHSLFNGLVSRILEGEGAAIPLAVVQADPVNIHSSWCNTKAQLTVCSTQEARQSCISQGMDPEKLTVVGFPIRRRFAEAGNRAAEWSYDESRPLKCLLMSGGEGNVSISRYAQAALELDNTEVTVICGRNEKLRRHLEDLLTPRYGQRIRILGFTEDMEQKMLESDLLITRGSPNSLFEAVVVNLPLVITGPLLEQERDNPRLMQENGLGVICYSPDELPAIINDLRRDNGAGLIRIRKAQHGYRCAENAGQIAEAVMGLIK
ncbi:MAG: hypothetical protein J5694_05895 [Erysipelotrichaceae bacterium]|nr:hypothetical protein [Erysipelotrichaceae bacterium]